MREVALAAIGVYQRYVSPYKGFCCAYREHTGRASCSALGARAIRRWGVWRGLGVLKLRLRGCSEVHRRCVDAQPRRPLATQRGACDFDFVPGDVDCSDAADCCDCGDCSSSERKARRQEKRQRRAAPAGRWDESADADASRRRDG
ncbi:membrane protein insertion efficiency factor YidD [Roseateles sp. P5_E7]